MLQRFARVLPSSLLVFAVVGASFTAGYALADTFNGGPGPDYEVGTNGNDRFFMGQGGDTARGRDGDDELNMGDGEDFGDGEGDFDAVLGDDGPDVLEGGSGHDVLRGSTAQDVLNAQLGDSENAYGGDGDDYIDVAENNGQAGIFNDDAWAGGGANDICKIDFFYDGGINYLAKDGDHSCEKVISQDQ